MPEYTVIFNIEYRLSAEDKDDAVAKGEEEFNKDLGKGVQSSGIRYEKTVTVLNEEGEEIETYPTQ